MKHIKYFQTEQLDIGVVITMSRIQIIAHADPCRELRLLEYFGYHGQHIGIRSFSKRCSRAYNGKDVLVGLFVEDIQYFGKILCPMPIAMDVKDRVHHKNAVILYRAKEWSEEHTIGRRPTTFKETL
jgi:hypothetical protein